MIDPTERRYVLDLLERRAISTDEAARLLDALGIHAAGPTVLVEVAAEPGNLQQVFTNLSRAFALQSAGTHPKEHIQ